MYWQLLDKTGSSNLSEQQTHICPILELLQDYEIIIIGEGEFGSVKLAKWLCQKHAKFIIRIKQERYIQQEESDYIHLSDLGLLPGTSFYLTGVKVTKQKGFGKFDVAAYWRRKYRGNGEDEGWYLLTNLGNLKGAIATFKCRSGIEAMFKDCKTGGYNKREESCERSAFKKLNFSHCYCLHLCSDPRSKN